MTKSTCWKISCKVAASLDFTRLSRQEFRLLENSPKTLSSLFGSSEQNFRRFCRVSAERDMKCSDTIWEEKWNKVFRLSERAMEWPSLFLRARSFEFRFSVGGGSRNSDCPNVRYGKFWKNLQLFCVRPCVHKGFPRAHARTQGFRKKIHFYLFAWYSDV